MAKPKSVYTCRECGASFPKWSGQCPDCRAWNALEEGVAAAPAQARGPKGRGNWSGTASASVSNLAEVRAEAARDRLSSGLSELDRVLGGGLVPGSVVLLGGDPGIGKSTLLLQAQDALAASHPSL
ncbi:MAG TPA: hypothetical protein VK972_00290 [Wenzhouxiangella sp.]|nr:hypothetical protein [Wenzhouxiangella sp.]